jgi:hypothetical protein
LQEYALCEAGVAFKRPNFIEAARRSAEAVLLPVLDWCLTAEHVLPFDLSCTVLGLAAVDVPPTACGMGEALDYGSASSGWASSTFTGRKPVDGWEHAAHGALDQSGGNHSNRRRTSTAARGCEPKKLCGLPSQGGSWRTTPNGVLEAAACPPFRTEFDG